MELFKDSSITITWWDNNKKKFPRLETIERYFLHRHNHLVLKGRFQKLESAD